MLLAVTQVVSWRNSAACRGAPLDLFISSGDVEDDPILPPPEASAYCDGCPVRLACLDWAMARGVEGVWGGLTAYQRRQLARLRDRAKCLSCGARDILNSGPIQLCLACGMSWKVGP